MSKKTFKYIVVMIIVLLLGTTTIFAFSNFNAIETIEVSDIYSMQNNTKNSYDSVSNGHFKLTLEETLIDDYDVFIIYSVEGLNDAAVEELMDEDDFKYKISISSTIATKPDTSIDDFAHSRELIEKRTNTTRSWIYYDKIENINNKNLILHFDAMSDEQYINIPINCNVETKDLILKGQSSGDVLVHLSPIGITIEKGINTCFAKTVTFTDVFFKMKNNEIKSYNQLTSIFKGSRKVMDDKAIDEGNRYKYYACFSSPVSLSDFKSIIVGGVEYDIDNQSKMSSIILDKSMYPIEVQALLLKDKAACISVQDVCNKLGADATWDGTKLKIKYRSSLVEIIDGSNAYIKDGQVIAYQMPQPYILCTYENMLYINWSILCEVLNVYAEEAVLPKTEEVPLVNDACTTVISTPQYTTWYIIP